MDYFIHNKSNKQIIYFHFQIFFLLIYDFKYCDFILNKYLLFFPEKSILLIHHFSFPIPKYYSIHLLLKINFFISNYVLLNFFPNHFTITHSSIYYHNNLSLLFLNPPLIIIYNLNL
jgi:hypothetical protein